KERIERLPAPFEVARRDGKAVIGKIAALLRNGQRQIIEMGLVGDPKLYPRAFKLLRECARGGGRPKCKTRQPRGERSAAVLHLCRSYDAEAAVVRMLALFGRSWQSLVRHALSPISCLPFSTLRSLYASALPLPDKVREWNGP